MQIPPFQIERYYAQHEFTAPYMLSSSDCESMTTQELLAYEAGATEEFLEQWLGYTESAGSPALRHAITALYTTIQAEQVLVFSGAEEGIFVAMNALLTAGDHVIVHSPCYQSLMAVAEAVGCEVSRWESREDEGWRADTDALRRLVRPTTRMIVVNSPHNPTGSLFTPAEQQAIVEIAQEHNLILFSDEVYRGSEHDPATQLPAACDLYENALSLGVTSKTYGLAGLRIGWLATRNRTFYEKLESLKDYTTICNSAPSEFLATIALRHHESLAARNRALCVQNLTLLDGFFNRHSDLFSWVRPRAGATGFARVNVPQGAEAFALEVVKGCGCLLLPSTKYDAPDTHVRLGFGRKNLPEALTVLERYLEGWRQPT